MFPTTAKMRTTLTPDLFTLNAASSACGVGMLWRAAIGLLAEVSVRAMVPDVISYSAALSACERAARWQTALFLLECMLQLGPKPDNIAFCAAASACGRGQQLEQALSLLPRLLETRLRPSEVTYNVLLAACERRRDWETGLWLFFSLKRDGRFGLRPDSVSCGSAASACAKAECWQEALELLTLARALHIAPDLCLFGAAISACRGADSAWPFREGQPSVRRFAAESARWRRGLLLLAESARAGLEPGLVAHNALLVTAPWHVGLELLRRLRGDGLHPDEATYGALVAACAVTGAPSGGDAGAESQSQSQSWAAALALLRDAKNAALDPGPGAVAAATNACARDGHSAPAVGLLLRLQREGLAELVAY
ncbi:unnamed protein product [Polarella glacialis]|uniref:Pentatricopeptide repeat-containing protein, chloroplastic n=1 Tax=Polarella glacialis TaxID=89957 RepID=A0A813E3H5_POLGL|nr:unnamed protein product [Polarella glacialis]